MGDQPEYGVAFENLLPVPAIEASDISEAMVYLCGKSGRYITGITLPVDAGFAVASRAAVRGSALADRPGASHPGLTPALARHPRGRDESGQDLE